MRQSKFRVNFVTGLHEMVMAFSEAEARILAQARQIEKGNMYDVADVEIIHDTACGEAVVKQIR